MKRMEVFPKLFSQFKVFLNMHRNIAQNWNLIPQCTISYILIRQIIPYHSIQNNFNSVFKDYILENKCSHCKCVIIYSSYHSSLKCLKLFCVRLRFCSNLIASHNIAQHIIKHHQAQHTHSIAQHSINISQHSMKS